MFKFDVNLKHGGKEPFGNFIRRTVNKTPDKFGFVLKGEKEEVGWVLQQEFGAGLGREAAPEYGITGPGKAYKILPHGDYPLRFPDPHHKYVGYHDEEGNVLLPQIPASKEDIGTSHPGYKPAHFIRNVYAEIQSMIRGAFSDATLNSEDLFNFEKVRDELVVSLAFAKEKIAKSMELALPNTRADGGKLKGARASDVFRAAVLWYPISNEADDTKGLLTKEEISVTRDLGT
jgi:hypothetical protein